MDKNFEELFTKVSELQKLQEEREKLKGERLELENRARAFFDSVIERYRQEESRIDERMEEAEPLVDYLYKYGTPHDVIIVRMDSVEHLSGEAGSPIEVRD